MSVSPSASRIPLTDRDGVVVACRVEVVDSPPIVPSRRPDAREVRVGRRVVELETTWREILLSAIQVGRPALLWLALFPDFAEEEFRGRVAPLRACLGMDKSPAGMPVVRRSVLYKHGAETTERAGFAYRLGMTMADWLCVTRLGMPSLTHLKLLPHDHPVRRASSRKHRSPDLVASRPGRRPSIAIVEAKCSEHLRLRERYEGAFQLDELRATGALRHYLQLLCGVSMEPHRGACHHPAPLAGRRVAYDPDRDGAVRGRPGVAPTLATTMSPLVLDGYPAVMRQTIRSEIFALLPTRHRPRPGQPHRRAQHRPRPAHPGRRGARHHHRGPGRQDRPGRARPAAGRPAPAGQPPGRQASHLQVQRPRTQHQPDQLQSNPKHRHPHPPTPLTTSAGP
jgi:hypothetical protein